jgi:hypothetical protein
MDREQPLHLSVFHIILLIIFIVSLSACLFSGKLEYMAVFFAIVFMLLIIYFIKWVINHLPSKFPGFVKNIIIVVFIFGFSACFFLGEFKIMLVISIIVFTVVIILNLLNLDSGHESSNATLTCKNGHTCRVWVDLTGTESSYFPGNPAKGEMIYSVGGHDFRRKSRIRPECCPKCGAEWLVPNKHNGNKRF